MSKFGFELKYLSLIGEAVPIAKVDFSKGLNVIVGASDTGKTFIVQCLNFMFGASTTPKNIPEAKPYSYVELGLKIGDRSIRLSRSIKGGNFTLTEENGIQLSLEAKGPGNKEDTVSNLLLEASGLKGFKVRKNQRGETQSLSFRDIVRLFLIDEESVIKEASPVHSGQYIFKTVESSIFQLLLTGHDDSGVEPIEDKRVSKVRQEGKREVVEFLLEKSKKQLPNGTTQKNLPELTAQSERLIQSIAQEWSSLQEAKQFSSEVEEARKRTWSELRQVESRLAVLSELQARFKLLEAQYHSDLNRLDAISETSHYLEQLPTENCPLCGASQEHHDHKFQVSDISMDDITLSATAEAIKIKSQLTDLKATIDSNDEEMSSLQKRQLFLKQTFGDINSKLSKQLVPRVESSLKNHTDLKMLLEQVNNRIQLIQRIVELDELLKEIDEPLMAPKVTFGHMHASREIDRFCRIVEEILQSWHFPNSDRVTFNASENDINISGSPRGSHGKGIRAITHAAFSLGLLEYCLNLSLPHPGLVIIDSPLVVYREPDKGEESFSKDVKAEFYRSLFERSQNQYQVIILENDQPPTDLVGKIHKIEFTGSGLGRKGFIP